MANAIVTKRYPAKFEEVLATHGIEWCNFDKKYLHDYCDGYFVPAYEIAGIAIEAIRGLRFEKVEDGWYCDLYFNHKHLDVEDEDFCKCVEKAIREVYK